ncbi:MAG TPA: cell division protein FtsH, partial [Tenuifilaceae bacterium]|nr:cell division protein FtsH [Tenuifilaceae bacterium]
MDNSKKKKDNDPFFGDGENKPKAPKFNVYWVYILIIAGIIFLQFFYSGKNAVVTSWQEVKNQMLVNKEVQKLVVIRNQGKVEVYLKEDKLE